MQINDTFEETYRKYPFSELVTLGIKLGGLIKRFRSASSGGSRLSGAEAVEAAR